MLLLGAKPKVVKLELELELELVVLALEIPKREEDEKSWIITRRVRRWEGRWEEKEEEMVVGKLDRADMEVGERECRGI